MPWVGWIWIATLVIGIEQAAGAQSGDIWVFLRDKKDELGQVIAWRDAGQGLSPAEWDLPIRDDYARRVRATGAQIRTRSLWLNAISVRATPDQQRDLRALDFVESLQRVRTLARPMPAPESALPSARPTLQDDYGVAFEQFAQAEVIPLHQMGYRGAGVRIAVLDNGFHYIEHRAFARLNVVAQRDFINEDEIVSDQVDQPRTGDETRSAQNLHGAQVLSIMAAYDPGRFIGVAPDAEYILAKTEENATELPVEEDRWIAGLEWSVRQGADVVNSSLGYNIWDTGDSYEYADLDGRTALTSIAAAMAAERGVVVVVAAGNEADTPWHYITAPADADGAIAVGSVDVAMVDGRTPVIASTSSRGPTADGRIKPDVVAPGQGVVVADVRGGDYRRSSGTSFAAPVVSGICALLLQIHPDWRPKDVLAALRSTALDLGDAGPDTVYGWGHVQALAASGLRMAPPDRAAALAPFPNPADGERVYFPLLVNQREEVQLSVFDLGGNLVFSRAWDMLSGTYTEKGNAPRWNIGADVANGMYFFRLHSASIDRSGTLAVIRHR